MLLTANGVTNLPPSDRRPGQDADQRRHDPRELRRVQPPEQRGRHVRRTGQDDRVPRAASTIASNSLAFGGTWTVHSEEATAGSSATLALQFTATTSTSS